MEDKDLSFEKFLEQLIQGILDIVDNFYGGYTIQKMKNDILMYANDQFFVRYPDAKKYNIVGQMCKKKRVYSEGLCKAAANIKLKILEASSFELWSDFEIEEQK